MQYEIQIVIPLLFYKLIYCSYNVKLKLPIFKKFQAAKKGETFGKKTKTVEKKTGIMANDV